MDCCLQCFGLCKKAKGTEHDHDERVGEREPLLREHGCSASSPGYTASAGLTIPSSSRKSGGKIAPATSNLASDSGVDQDHGDGEEGAQNTFTDVFNDVLDALSAGNLPTQEQISKFLKMLLDSELLEVEDDANGADGDDSGTGPRSTFGRKFLGDVREALEGFLTFGKEKNADDKLQEIYSQFLLLQTPTLVKKNARIPHPATENMERQDQAISDAAATLSELPSSSEISFDTLTLLSALRTLVETFLSSPSFRLILSELVGIAREVVGVDTTEGSLSDERQLEDEIRTRIRIREILTRIQKDRASRPAIRAILILVRKYADVLAALSASSDGVLVQAVEGVLSGVSDIGVVAPPASPSPSPSASASFNVPEPTLRLLRDIKEMVQRCAAGRSLDPLLAAFGRVVKELSACESRFDKDDGAEERKESNEDVEDKIEEDRTQEKGKAKATEDGVANGPDALSTPLSGEDAKTNQGNIVQLPTQTDIGNFGTSDNLNAEKSNANLNVNNSNGNGTKKKTSARNKKKNQKAKLKKRMKAKEKRAAEGVEEEDEHEEDEREEEGKEDATPAAAQSLQQQSPSAPLNGEEKGKHKTLETPKPEPTSSPKPQKKVNHLHEFLFHLGVVLDRVLDEPSSLVLSTPATSSPSSPSPFGEAVAKAEAAEVTAENSIHALEAALTRILAASALPTVAYEKAQVDSGHTSTHSEALRDLVTEMHSYAAAIRADAASELSGLSRLVRGVEGVIEGVDKLGFGFGVGVGTERNFGWRRAGGGEGEREWVEWVIPRVVKMVVKMKLEIQMKTKRRVKAQDVEAKMGKWEGALTGVGVDVLSGGGLDVDVEVLGLLGEHEDEDEETLRPTSCSSSLTRSESKSKVKSRSRSSSTIRNSAANGNKQSSAQDHSNPTSTTRICLRVTLKNVRLQMADVRYRVRNGSSWWGCQDVGVLDVDVRGGDVVVDVKVDVTLGVHVRCKEVGVADQEEGEEKYTPTRAKSASTMSLFDPSAMNSPQAGLNVDVDASNSKASPSPSPYSNSSSTSSSVDIPEIIIHENEREVEEELERKALLNFHLPPVVEADCLGSSPTVGPLPPLASTSTSAPASSVGGAGSEEGKDEVDVKDVESEENGALGFRIISNAFYPPGMGSHAPHSHLHPHSNPPTHETSTFKIKQTQRPILLRMLGEERVKNDLLEKMVGDAVMEWGVELVRGGLGVLGADRTRRGDNLYDEEPGEAVDLLR